MVSMINAKSSFLAALLVTAPLTHASADDDVQGKIQQYLQACVDVEQLMGAVLVMRDNRELVAGGFGFANVEHQVPNTRKTKFRLGSITKQFTAMAIMILAEQGKLTLDDPIQKHLEGSPDAWKDVTIHHLLSHTSAIPNFTAFPDYTAKMTLPATPLQIIDRFKDKPLEFMPGEQFAYSNSGYIVLGALIEKASGKSYEQFLKEAIFEPLEMRDTDYDHHDQIIAERASGYDGRDGKLLNAPYIDMSVPFAAGALFSTIEDMQRWDRALRSGKLISAQSLEKMITPVKNGFGYGWQMETRCDHRLMKHGGGINGFTTYMIHIPDMQALVVVLSNIASHRTGRMAHDLVAILFDEPNNVPRTRHAVELDRSAYEGLVGVYRLVSNLQLSITLDDGRLYSTIADEAKEEMFAESATEFFYKDDAQITFFRGDNGRANRLVLHQGGSDLVGIRLESAADEPHTSRLGIHISPLCAELRKRQQLDDAGGLAAVEVVPGSTAAEAGIQAGDVILSLNGSRVTDVSAFLVQVSTIQPGDPIELEIVREGQKAIKRGTMKERPPETK
jgi:CubicO group peptidase (beta-lactamase class C family)